MRPATLIVGATFVIAFGAITFLRLRDREPEPGDRRSGADVEAIRDFWNLYGMATQARLAEDCAGGAKLYRAALELQPQHQDSLFYLAVCLEATANYSEAADVLRTMTSIHANNGRAWMQLGRVTSTFAPGARPDLDEAESAFTRSEELNPEHSGPFLAHGRLALERGRLEDAIRYFDIAADMGAPEGIFLAGLARYVGGDDAEAAERFRRVLEGASTERTRRERGTVSEGDVRREGRGQPSGLTPLQRATILARYFLRAAERRLAASAGSGSSSSGDVRDNASSLEGSATGKMTFKRVSSLETTEGRPTFLDYDGDGRQDLLLVSTNHLRLFRNTENTWVDVTDQAGLSSVRGGFRARAVDLDDDGWIDLCVLRAGYTGTGTNTFLKNVKGSFVDTTETWGLSGERATSDVVALDANADGRTDFIEVGNTGFGAPSVRLYVREGASFAERAEEWGLEYPAHVVDADVADIDGDGALDLFLLGWRTPSRLFRNAGGRFVDATSDTGLDGIGGNGFNAVFFDYDNDARADLLVTANASLAESLLRMSEPETRARNNAPLLLHNEGGRFELVSAELGLDRAFGIIEAVATDFDGDGFSDLLFALGGLQTSHLEPSLILKNQEGRAFVPSLYVPSMDSPVRSLGAEAADVNQDGKADFFLSGAGLYIHSSP